MALVEQALARTAANTGVTLVIALNYGSQDEIARAAAKAAAKGLVTPESISAELDTAGLPPLDLLIRTSGEIRLSNFLLWQAAYAEMWFTDVHWPDFTPAHLEKRWCNSASGSVALAAAEEMRLYQAGRARPQAAPPPFGGRLVGVHSRRRVTLGFASLPHPQTPPRWGGEMSQRSVLVTPRTKSDLGVRTLSALVMVVVAGGALWLGAMSGPRLSC